MTEALSKRQEKHYDEISSDYAAHYYDDDSMSYRREFIYDPLLSGLNLNKLTIADLASGEGATSLEILRRYRDAQVTGYDISSVACQRYRDIVGAAAFHCDLTDPKFIINAQYDVVIIIGGLHHCVSDLKQTIKNINRILKPGGYLLVMEPNAEYGLEFIRRLWYRIDKYFDNSSERALKVSEISQCLPEVWECKMVKYIGGPAYYFILNSLLFRVPLGLKRFITPPLLVMERLYARLPMSPRRFYPVFLARWQKPF